MNPTAPIQPKRKRLVIPALASALLVGMGLTNASFPTAQDAEPYHTKILALAADSPTAFAPWESRPIDVPPSAVELLRPNAMLSRYFTDPVHERSASLLIVQCKDARDLSGHWPPNCYKTSGYTQSNTQMRHWPTPGQSAGTAPSPLGTPAEPAQLSQAGLNTSGEVAGVEYTFDMETSQGATRLVVANFLIVPGVGLVPDMESVRDAGADPRRRSLGAAQVQVVTDGSYSQAERDAIFAELLEPHWPLIEAIANADTH